MDILLTTLFEAIRILGKLIFDFYLWVPIVGVVLFGIWQNVRRQRWVSTTDHVLLVIEVPKDNEKQELAAEQMFAALHGILRSKRELAREGALQEYLSFEIVAVENRIRFYVWTPRNLKQFIEGQIYAQYPNVHIHEAPEDYAKQNLEHMHTAGIELKLTQNETLPIRTFNDFEVDPLAAITAVLAKLEEGEQLWIQILARPTDDNWHKKGERFINRLKEGKGSGGPLLGNNSYMPLRLPVDFVVALWQPPTSPGEKGASSPSKPELTDTEKAIIAAANEKINKLGYQVKIRIAHIGPDPQISRVRLQSIVGAYKQFNAFNGFAVKKNLAPADAVPHYRARLFDDRGDILNIEELASLYHLPHTNVETPNMVWATTKTAEPPSNVPAVSTTPPHELSPLGVTNFRGQMNEFGLKRSDRGRHAYIIGQTGTGKSGALTLLALSDIYQNHGFAIIDPHGDVAVDLLRYIPRERINDVVYFNPTDREYPIAFNPMEITDPAQKGEISSELVGSLKRMFDYSWGPRLEYILRYTILALLDYPDSTMMHITRMLTDQKFRDDVVRNIQDPVVRSFWVNEFASWEQKFANEAVAPILNKVGAFTANPLVRNIIGQPHSAFNVRKMMDEGKIFVVNLSRGQIGEDNASVLGSLLVTKIQLSAMSRADVLMEQRRPFYLYVDEFQNFATDSFAVILSEARKYGLNLTVANQYIAQMSDEVRDAVFGNVGTIISFRTGADDAPFMEKYFAPTFVGDDIIRQHNRHFIITMSIDGEKAFPFTAKSLELPPHIEEFVPEIVEHTRATYAKPREEVEKQVGEWVLSEREREQYRSGGNDRGGRPGAPRGRSNNNNSQNRNNSGSKNKGRPAPPPRRAPGAGQDNALNSDGEVTLR